MLNLKHTVLGVLLCVLAACATVNTFNKQIVVANASVESAASTVSLLYGAGKLTEPEARKVYERLVDVRTGIEAARRVHATNAQEGSTLLTTALAALQEINTYLLEKENAR